MSETPHVLPHSLIPKSGNITLSHVWLQMRHLSPGLRDISLSFPEGRATAVLGPVHSGKTALIRLTAGLLSPTRGEISWRNTGFTLQARQRLGFVPEWGYFPEELSLLECLETALLSYGCGPRSHRRDMAADALKLWDLAHVARRKVGNSPPDLLKALAWAIATVHSPDVLIADEPLLGCRGDTVTQVDIWVKAQKEKRKTLIFASRDPERIIGWCDGYHVLRGGELVASDIEARRGDVSAGSIGGKSYLIEVSGLDRDRADSWRKNHALPLWDDFSVQGFLARLVFQAEADAAKWLTQSVKSNMVVLNFGAMTDSRERQILDHIRPFFLGDSKDTRGVPLS